MANAYGSVDPMKALSEFGSSRRYGTGLSQHGRLITLVTAQKRGLLASLVAEQFAGREAINELFSFEIDALSVSTDLDLSIFIGEDLTVTLLQPTGCRRAWHGICTHASWSGADGGVARYRLRMEPALSLLALRRDCHVFQGKNAREIVTELLADYPQVRFDFDITQELLIRPICTQYRETDFEFFERLLASEGLSWRFEHDQMDVDDRDDPGHSKHRLVIFDSRARAPAMPNGQAIRFHGARATDTDDAIDEFSARRCVSANGVAISSWNPAQLIAPSAELESILDAGELPLLQIYDGSGEGGTGRAEAARQGELMLQALELKNKVFQGAGAVRRLRPGHAFLLTQHDRYSEGQNCFNVLWVRHEARNNFDTGIASAAAKIVESGTYRNTFGCVRDEVAIVPARTTLTDPCTAQGPQTALVVGVAGSVATTTRDHQVKVQFAWQRGSAPNAAGLAHNTDHQGNAPGDERSGTWVRVTEALAGPNWGTQFTPRVGTEVLVDFIEGDIDRPVIVAQLYTGADLPPFAAGVDSEVNHAGVLSGIHTTNFDGSGYNQWQLDDTNGQVRTRLASSSAATELNLGYLIQQTASSAHRGSYRGSGFELRTDAWAVLRGGEGVLLSTSARARQGSGVASTQMDAAEAVSLFKAAQALSNTLNDAASQQQALVSKDAAKAQADFIEQLDPKAKGKYTSAINGQQAIKAKNGSRELDAGQAVEKFGSAIVLMDSAASINWATPASTLIFAGQQLHWTMQSDLHITAAHTASSVAGSAANFFTHSGGIQAIAANGPVSLQAHTDQLEILADQAVTVISVNDSIEITARDKVVLQAGQCAVTLDGQNITFACPGKFSVKGGQHLFDAGAFKEASVTRLPDSRPKLFDEGFVLRDEDTGSPLPNYPYRIVRADGSIEAGITDEEGRTHVVSSAEIEEINIEIPRV